MEAVIVDNELSSISLIQEDIAKYCPEVTITGTFTNVPAAVRGINSLKPDVVFLDIELDDDTTGFDVLEEIPDRTFEVIFVTAYNKYAVRAFHFAATHFLEKPIDS